MDDVPGKLTGSDEKSEARISNGQPEAQSEAQAGKTQPRRGVREKRAGEQPRFKFTHPFTFIRRIFGGFIFSSLTRRILFLNLAALLVLVSGILYLNQFREGLIDARVESLLTQGEIISGAIAASASVETDSITIDPQKLLELQAGESLSPTVSDDSVFPFDPKLIAPVLRRVISPTRTRARIYDQDAVLLLDSRFLYTSGQVLRFDLDEPEDEEDLHIWERISKFFNALLQPGNLSIYREQKRKHVFLFFLRGKNAGALFLSLSFSGCHVLGPRESYYLCLPQYPSLFSHFPRNRFPPSPSRRHSFCIPRSTISEA